MFVTEQSWTSRWNNVSRASNVVMWSGVLSRRSSQACHQSSYASERINAQSWVVSGASPDGVFLAIMSVSPSWDTALAEHVPYQIVTGIIRVPLPMVHGNDFMGSEEGFDSLYPLLVIVQ